MRKENEILMLIEDWVMSRDEVRTAILTSSRTSGISKIDFLSDYDVELFVSDIDMFMSSDEWLDFFGKTMIKWPYKPKTTISKDWLTRLVLFEDGVRIDFQITSNMTIDEERYMNGYKVISDKDCITKNLEEATFDKFVIQKPTEDMYKDVVNEFWWNAYYIPKYLWRDELPFVKFMMDNIMRYEYLHRIVNWRIGYQNDWKVETGSLGRHYKKLMNHEDWIRFESSYSGSGDADHWNDFERMTGLFRDWAIELSEDLNYEYPYEVDEKVVEFSKMIMGTEK